MTINGHRSAAVKEVTKAVVHHKAPVLGLHVRGQTVRTWLISPETLVGHLLSQRALAIRTLSHLLRTGRTRLRRRHPRRLLRGPGAWSGRNVCISRLCANHTQLTQPSTQACMCTARGANGIQTCSTTSDPPTDRKTSQTRHPICTPALTLDDTILGGHSVCPDADAKLLC